MTRTTLARTVTAEGIALHAGVSVRMTLTPAPPGHGIVFRRDDRGSRTIPALYNKVTETRLGTVIDDGQGTRIGVIEHLMAAIAGAGIADLLVTLDGPEPPILDGDALSYLSLIETGGVTTARAPGTALRILKPVRVEAGNASASLLPAQVRSFAFDIEFSTAAIGRQRFDWTFSTDGFRREIAPARTFGFLHELEALHQAGLGRGASLENTLAIDGDRVVNAAIMRFPDEFVRHKILDAIGDLALAGMPVIGRFVGVRSGHALNNALLRALCADASAFERVELTP
ncbi:MAG: UDP-3-O-[3-hydroxymyristoyl] N-acetylglucosamine deacetylase [Alphaproteobacteria bacterium]|jgi:UDP-3-O-[3-hydroxymyristoyl] N-acetylglucosamine deacetylase|nr:UDP-3-O-[3-hydroxymyristoyl] N-acetylglucosamine deacetylase [Alphaproteobacteria bacterium]MBN9567539.1 UDP-3-O-[3-hydroxymyristoyl] N-acetylglucosamine deacetylase [Alphaproteobacteria bacterium]MBN9579612.1 UDP-3-O-[3-hydroxymyristoyl] N-acetylglucosamine deacetylase [Alphaproteobacteria bacterium]OJU57411.1 MAG: UDP-3-O-[3-hydroxymyristoyl] N-acetylglucosamine deacetylase [Alphaproteobacteria bacterium 62-8]